LRTTAGDGGARGFLFREFLRRRVGDAAYRAVTQTPRLMNYLFRPHYESEAEALPQLVTTGMTCFDIGANYGHYSRLLSPIVGESGGIYAFEPSAITCQGLRNARFLLRLRNVHITQCALADAPGALALTIPVKRNGGLGVALAHLGDAADRRPGLAETVAVNTLDGFMRERGVAACDFIKCDVEGAELRVLEGGLDTIGRFRPTMLLEIDASYLRRNHHTIADVESLLRQQDYQFYVWGNDSLQAQKALSDQRNNFAIHRSRRQASSSAPAPDSLGERR
jgi:FkbM family methyltransferase